MRTDISRKDKIQPVILCGGEGCRLWPLSTPGRPKPFALLPHSGKESLLSAALARISDQTLFHPPLIIGHKDQIQAMQAHCEQAGICATIITEPAGRNTAPAVAAACHYMQQHGKNDTPLLILPADHQISPLKAFHDNLSAALPLCQDGHIVLFGIKPHAPVSEFGYIIPADNFGTANNHNIKSFIEKPDKNTAQQLIENENALWNSGIFMVQADKALQALQQHQPSLDKAVRASWDDRTSTSINKTITHITLDPSFENAPAISFDKAVIEHEEDLRLILAGFAWADLGLWRTLWEQMSKKNSVPTRENNTIIAHDCRNSPLYSEGPLICAIGLENIAVYARDDMILIAPVTGHEDLNATLKQARVLHDQKQDSYKAKNSKEEPSG